MTLGGGSLMQRAARSCRSARRSICRRPVNAFVDVSDSADEPDRFANGAPVKIGVGRRCRGARRPQATGHASS
jgi:hypothetical protein